MLKKIEPLIKFTSSALGTGLLGLIWVLFPSMLIYTVGSIISSYIAWPMMAVQVAAINVFVLWIAIHILFLAFNRYMGWKIRSVINDYHIELITLRNRYDRKTGGISNPAFDKSMDELKRELEN